MTETRPPDDAGDGSADPVAVDPRDRLGLTFEGEPRRGVSRFGRGVLFLVVLAIAVAVPIAAVLVGGGRLLGGIGEDTGDYAGAGSGSVVIQIRSGQSVTAVGHTLHDAEVVRSVGAFVDAASGKTLQPGYYRMRRKMSGAAAVTLLGDPAARVVTKITVPEGFTTEKIAALVAAKTSITVAQMTAAFAAPKSRQYPEWAGGSVEGFLFPATYEVDPGTTADQLVTQMINLWGRQTRRLGLEAGSRALGHSPHDVLTVASIAEAEVKRDQDYAKVTRVLYNRLAAAMPLQVDSTLNYVLDNPTLNLTSQQLATDTPYNTRDRVGLPPTAIGNPGAKAIRAALHPATGDWLYFVTVDKQGRTEFTDSYQQFLSLKAQAKRNGVLK